MPSSLGHAMVAVAAGSVVAPRDLLRPFLVVGAVCVVAPDLDAIGRLGFGGDVNLLGGHRAFTHSLAFAVLMGVLVSLLTLSSARWRGSRIRMAFFATFVTASHGALDWFTSIGAATSPVQFFSPFSCRGYTALWHPINGPFSELFLVIVPLAVFTCLTWRLRGIPWPRRRREHVILGLSR